MDYVDGIMGNADLPEESYITSPPLDDRRIANYKAQEPPLTESTLLSLLEEYLGSAEPFLISIELRQFKKWLKERNK